MPWDREIDMDLSFPEWSKIPIDKIKKTETQSKKYFESSAPSSKYGLYASMEIKIAQGKKRESNNFIFTEKMRIL